LHFLLVIHVDGTLLLYALFSEEFVPVASLVKGASVCYRSPVETPASNFGLKHWAWVTLSRFNAAAWVGYPATVFFFQLGLSPTRKRMVEVFKLTC